MARYIGAVCRQCRAAGAKLFLKGDRCNTAKCAITRRSYKAGMHGQKRTKPTEYGVRLMEKQKARRIYGLMETQFSGYFEKATGQRGVTGEVLLQLLERRLDNVVYRLGLATSRRASRQMVSHGAILVNGRRVNIPSFQVKVGDKLQVAEGFKDVVTNTIKDRTLKVPAWLTFDSSNLSASVASIPNRAEIDTVVQEQMIVEFYSR